MRTQHRDRPLFLGQKPGSLSDSPGQYRATLAHRLRERERCAAGFLVLEPDAQRSIIKVLATRFVDYLAIRVKEVPRSGVKPLPRRKLTPALSWDARPHRPYP